MDKKPIDLEQVELITEEVSKDIKEAIKRIELLEGYSDRLVNLNAKLFNIIKTQGEDK